MNINQARGLLNQIEALLYSGTDWDIFWRNISNEIRAGDVDGLFHEALVKLHALGALDINLNDFISVFIRSQIQRFYKELYRTRRWHLIHKHVYTYSDVLSFVEDSQTLINLLRKKIEKIHAESCNVSEKFYKHTTCGTGVLICKQNPRRRTKQPSR